jgi:serine/threonine protein phosphatase PrpC
MEEIITKATADNMKLDKLAEKLVIDAKAGGTKDNTTVLIIELKRENL